MTEVLWRLPLATSAFTDVEVVAEVGTILVNNFDPARHEIVWQGDVDMDGVTITVSATTLQTGTLPIQTVTFWGWGVRESDLLNLTVLEVPTGVTLADFAATPTDSEILVTWETASETDNLGYNLWRGTSPDAPGEQLNEELILSQSPGGGQGAFYEWLDDEGMPGTSYYYWLEAVSTQGTMTRYGPVSATVPIPTAVTIADFRIKSPPDLGWWLIIGIAFIKGWRRWRRAIYQRSD